MSDEMAGECFDYYMKLHGRPPTVFELWGWNDAATEVRLDSNLDGTWAV